MWIEDRFSSSPPSHQSHPQLQILEITHARSSPPSHPQPPTAATTLRAATTTPSCFWPSPKSSNQFPEITKLQKSPKHSSPSSHTQPSALFALASSLVVTELAYSLVVADTASTLLLASSLDNVRDMVDNFLEFVVNNHHVNREREPVSMLQAFQISLVRTAISNIFI
ncbi:hypothetical protein HN873_032228 [Arachis hypogaea]